MAPAKKIDATEIMVVNDIPGEECRIAILQENHLEDLYGERTSTATNVGNIYKGRVINVEPAIQAAFIDYGTGQNGFLHISDLHPRYFPGKGRTERVGKKIPRRERPLIQQALKRGNEVLVQVLKEGLGTKGPTLTSYLSIPGRLMVAMPEMDRVGVSRKVEDEEKRREMRKVLDSLDLPEGFGFILRTAGFGQPKAELKRDLAYLMRLWRRMDNRIKNTPAPCELYAESDLLIRTVRDVLRPTISAIVVDSESAYQRASDFLRVVAPRSAPEVIHYTRKAPIFHAFDVERQIELIHSREVPLPSGGKLNFDQTEALVAIDVNSGKSRSARDSESNAYQTNCEAVDEISRQLRLRDLGGLIINDLIDMRVRNNRRAIEERFRNNLKRDRARSTILPISEFGLVEMTRQRMRPSLRKSHFVPCQHCDGRGEIKSPESVGSDAARQIGYLLQFDRVQRVEVVCSPRVASVMLSSKRRELVRMEDAVGKRIDVRVSDAIAVDRVDFYAYDERNADIDIDRLPQVKVPTLKELEEEAKAKARADGKKKPAAATAPQPDAAPPAEPDEEDEHEEQAEQQKRKRPRRRRRRRKAESPAASAAGEAPPQPAADGQPAAAAEHKNPGDRQPVRIHVLAKELGVPSREVIQRCDALPEIKVRNHMSTLPPQIAESIRQWFGAEPEPAAPPAASQAGDGKGPKRRRRRGGASRKPRAEAAGPAPAPNGSATAADESASASEVSSDETRRSRGKPDRSSSGRPARKKSRSKSDRPAKRSGRARRAGGDAGADQESDMSKDAPDQSAQQDVAARPETAKREAEPSASRKPRRRLYRNRSRVSPTAREQAERKLDE